MRFTGTSKEQLLIETISDTSGNVLKDYHDDSLTIIWNLEHPMALFVDGVEFCLSPGQLVFLTEFHRVAIKSISLARVIRFNRPFYCVVDHDEEVSCKGVLFFGASKVPVISIPTEESEKFEILWRMLNIEMQSRDNLQKEMLQIMLKRFIILCTRRYKEQNQLLGLEKSRLDLVREFNYLVEVHFQSKHTVAEYARILNKSPKTLSNLFSLYNQKSPLQIIQDRIILEARRQLFYTDKAIKEIAYETGFEDIQSFSRFFKSKEGVSPKEYREKSKPLIV